MFGDLSGLPDENCSSRRAGRLSPSSVFERGPRLLEFVQQLDRQAGKLLTKSRVLDLVRDAGGELASEAILLGLDQVGLGGLIDQ